MNAEGDDAMEPSSYSDIMNMIEGLSDEERLKLADVLYKQMSGPHTASSSATKLGAIDISKYDYHSNHYINN